MGPSIGCRTSLAELLLPSHLLVLISPGSACLLILIIRNRLKYALSYCEVISILMQHHVLVDGKVRTDKTYPAGFMDVFPSPRQTRTAGCFMTPRFASVFTQSGMRMLSSSSARLGLFCLARRAYPLPEHL